MKRIWALVADEGVARVLESPGEGANLVELETLTDAAAHADRADLRRDAYGRRSGGGSAGGTVTSSAGEDEKRLEAGKFARRVAEWLTDQHRKQRFDGLKVSAPPRFLGELREAFGPELSNVVLDELDKDLIHEDARSITQRLFPSEG